MTNCAEYSKRYRERHPEKAKEVQRRYREANRDKIMEHKREVHAAHPERKSASQKKYYAANRDKRRAYEAEYWAARPGERKAKYARYRANNLERVRTKQLRQYGITQQDYESMAADQGNACWICKAHASTEKKGVLHVDHDHTTGKVRGLLCSRCNGGIGMFRDNSTFLEGAIRYLEKAAGDA